MKRRRLQPTLLTRCVFLILIVLGPLVVVYSASLLPVFDDRPRWREYLQFSAMAWFVVAILLEYFGFSMLAAYLVREVLERTDVRPPLWMFRDIDEEDQRQIDAVYKNTENNPTIR